MVAFVDCMDNRRGWRGMVGGRKMLTAAEL